MHVTKSRSALPIDDNFHEFLHLLPFVAQRRGYYRVARVVSLSDTLTMRQPARREDLKPNSRTEETTMSTIAFDDDRFDSVERRELRSRGNDSDPLEGA